VKERKLQRKLKKYKILLDTSFVLPFFGIEVENIPDSVVDKIVFKGNLDFIYPKLMLVELIAVISKKVKEINQIPKFIEERIESLLISSDIKIIDPKPKHLVYALKLRKLGHPDIFDCLAYATAVIENSLFLTVDKNFINFLKDNDLNVGIIISPDTFKKI